MKTRFSSKAENHRQGCSGKENLNPLPAGLDAKMLSFVNGNKIQTKMLEPSGGLLASRFCATRSILLGRSPRWPCTGWLWKAYSRKGTEVLRVQQRNFGAWTSRFGEADQGTIGGTFTCPVRQIS